MIRLVGPSFKVWESATVSITSRSAGSGYDQFTLNHNLGVIPDFAVLVHPEAVSSGRIVFDHFYRHPGGIAYEGVYCYSQTTTTNVMRVYRSQTSGDANFVIASFRSAL